MSKDVTDNTAVASEPTGAVEESVVVVRRLPLPSSAKAPFYL